MTVASQLHALHHRVKCWSVLFADHCHALRIIPFPIADHFIPHLQVTVPWSKVLSAKTAEAALWREERAGRPLLPLGVAHFLQSVVNTTAGARMTGDVHSWTILMAMQLLVELRNPRSPWHPYVPCT